MEGFLGKIHLSEKGHGNNCDLLSRLKLDVKVFSSTLFYIFLKPR